MRKWKHIISLSHRGTKTFSRSRVYLPDFTLPMGRVASCLSVSHRNTRASLHVHSAASFLLLLTWCALEYGLMQFCFRCVGWAQIWRGVLVLSDVHATGIWVPPCLNWSLYPFFHSPTGAACQTADNFSSSAKGRQALCRSLGTYPTESRTKYCASGLTCPVLAAWRWESATILCVMLSGDGAMKLFQTKIRLQTVTWTMEMIKEVWAEIGAQDTMG